MCFNDSSLRLLHQQELKKNSFFGAVIFHVIFSPTFRQIHILSSLSCQPSMHFSLKGKSIFLLTPVAVGRLSMSTRKSSLIFMFIEDFQTNDIFVRKFTTINNFAFGRLYQNERWVWRRHKLKFHFIDFIWKRLIFGWLEHFHQCTWYVCALSHFSPQHN